MSAARKYAKTHEWVSVDGNTAAVGISDFAVHALTDLVYIDLPKVGRSLTKGAVFGVVESVKAASDLYSPIDGTVTEVNSSLEGDLATLTADPFGTGWQGATRIGGASGTRTRRRPCRPLRPSGLRRPRRP